MTKNILIIDTEGQEIIREIAIIDAQGKTIYHAFLEGHYNNENVRINLASLVEIVTNLEKILPHTQIICHHAQHDQRILKNSFRQAKKAFPPVKFICTFQLTKEKYPDFSNYSLGYLSKQLRLKLGGRFFQESQAHSALYDARFTNLLYNHLSAMNTKNLSQYPNPFSSNRVDNPFQNHLDYNLLYQSQYQGLTAILEQIKNDENSQSKGAVILGVAGAGKTHLIMRIAQNLLKRNRLLFIRQPNNSDAVFYHIYSRVLESFSEKVPDTNRSQLEFLIAHSFIVILTEINQNINDDKITKIIEKLQDNSLSLYSLLGTENTQQYQKNWTIIEKRILNWWNTKYSQGGYSSEILLGMIKFCRYNRQDLKDLTRNWLAGKELEDEEAGKIGLKNWTDDLSREEFALSALSVFGKLSLLDEPLIIVFDQLEGLGYTQNKTTLESFGLAVKEVLTHVPNSLVILNLFPETWQQFQNVFDNSVIERLSQHCFSLNHPNQDTLKDILALKFRDVGLELEKVFTPQDIKHILSQNSIRSVLNLASDYFRYYADNIPLPKDNKQVNSSSESSLTSRIDVLENTLFQIRDLIKKAELPIILPDPDPIIDPKPDEKLKKYIEEKTAFFTEKYYQANIITDSDDIGKIINLVDILAKIEPNIDRNQLRLNSKKIPEHIAINNQKNSLVIGFLHMGGAGFTRRLSNFNELVATNKQMTFKLFRDAQENIITAKVGKLEIEKLNNTNNGKFILMEQNERVNLELIYQLIIDIQQKDVDFDMGRALNFCRDNFSEDHLIKPLLTTFLP
ncbi:MAG: exonuclease [Cyanobacterium sp. T60_A2020_053]|nr:exonuclease [Cyanobacterium sp. T60_A2020_053]